MIKILISFLFFATLFPASATSISADFPPIVLMRSYQLEIVCQWSGNQWEASLFIVDDNRIRGDAGVLIQRNPAEIVKGEGFIAINYTDHRGEVIAVSSFELKEVRIIVEAPIAANCAEIPFSLEQVRYLDSLDMNSITSFEIDLEAYSCPVVIDLQEFKQFESIKSGLRRFALKSAQNVEFDIRSLYDCPHLWELELPFCVGGALDHFTELEVLKIPGISSVFVHQIATLPDLADWKELPSLYDNQFETLHAERYFEELLPLRRTASPIVYSRLEELEETIKKYAPEKWTDDGEILIMENELMEYGPGSVLNDTLLHGFMKKGKRKGLWTVKFADQYRKSDWETHHFNFKKKMKVKFPQNGIWNLKYANNNIAISGEFKNGLKVGEWKFFNEDGTIRTQRFYKMDTLERTIVHFSIQGLACESRAYYFSQYACVQSFSNVDGTTFNYVDMDPSRDPIFVDGTTIHLLNEAKTVYKPIKKGTRGYETALREHFVQYLFPELTGKELPF